MLKTIIGARLLRKLARTSCATLLLGTWVLISPAQSQESAREAFKSLPLAVICERANSLTVVYLSQVEEDGSAIYMAPNSRAITISKGGMIASNGGAEGGCAGQSVDELREKGLVIERVR
jgi:hypothetical protein